MTFREDIEPTLIAEHVRYEALERSAKTLESTISEHVPESLARNIKTVAAELRKAAAPHRTRYEEIRKALEKQHSKPDHGPGGNK
jgi:hypothetical protein